MQPNFTNCNAECNQNVHSVHVNNEVIGSNATSCCFLPGVAPFVPGRSFCPPHMGYVPNILTNGSQFRPQFAANQTLFPSLGSLNQVLGATNMEPNMNSQASVPVPRPSEINSEVRNDLSSKDVHHKDNDKDSHHIYNTTRTPPAGGPGVTEKHFWAWSWPNKSKQK